MKYCDALLQQGRVEEPCDEPASTRIDGRWYCELHADSLERFLARCSKPEWAEEIRRQLETQPDLEDDSDAGKDYTEDSLSRNG
jgi:hypothetical protein